MSYRLHALSFLSLATKIKRSTNGKRSLPIENGTLRGFNCIKITVLRQTRKQEKPRKIGISPKLRGFSLFAFRKMLPKKYAIFPIIALFFRTMQHEMQHDLRFHIPLRRYDVTSTPTDESGGDPFQDASLSSMESMMKHYGFQDKLFKMSI